MIQESQVERSEYQDDSYVRHQTFPEKVSEEQDIHADYDSYQQYDDDRYNVWGVHIHSSTNIDLLINGLCYDNEPFHTLNQTRQIVIFKK
jgi:hypothetical protein